MVFYADTMRSVHKQLGALSLNNWKTHPVGVFRQQAKNYRCYRSRKLKELSQKPLSYQSESSSCVIIYHVQNRKFFANISLPYDVWSAGWNRTDGGEPGHVHHWLLDHLASPWYMCHIEVMPYHSLSGTVQAIRRYQTLSHYESLIKI